MKTQPRGFSFVELLMTLTVALILALLFFPALLNARQAAVRLNCKNNLKQYGIALHSYHDSFETFPPGYIYRIDPKLKTNAAGYSWSLLIAPFMEERTIYQVTNFDSPISSPANGQARLSEPQIASCPADRWNEPGDKYVHIGQTQFARSSYVASFGPGNVDTQPNDRRGVFSRNSFGHTALFSDGLANTIFLGERRGGSAVKGSSLEYKTTYAGVASTTENVDNARLVLFQSGNGFGKYSLDHRGASSEHPGGVHFMIGDGAVRFLNESMERQLFRDLTTRDGGELIPDF